MPNLLSRNMLLIARREYLEKIRGRAFPCFVRAEVGRHFYAPDGFADEVGRGIAVAFVATIYGVGIANLFFLPFAGKMRIRIREGHRRREMLLEGVISILEGINPRMLEIKLAGFINDAVPGKTERAA